MEFQGAEEKNMEEEVAAVMEEVIYVAVGRETAKNKSNLTWAIDNSQGNKICILLVHQPPHTIPVCKFFFSPHYKSKKSQWLCHESFSFHSGYQI